MKHRLLSSIIVTVLLTWALAAQVSLVSDRFDGRPARVNLTETKLTAANVNVSGFGKLYSYPLNGPVYAQPLYATDVSIAGARYNVLYVATGNHKLYVFDADGSSTKPLWISNVAQADSQIAASNSAVSWDSPGDGPLAYAWSENDVLKAYRAEAGRITTPAYMQGDVLSPDLAGASLTLSANGRAHGTGIVWAAIPAKLDGVRRNHEGLLHAFDAETLREIWTSEQNPTRDHAGALPRFVPPLVANGYVYMPTLDGALVVYGLLPASMASNVAPMAAGTGRAPVDGSQTVTVSSAPVSPAIGIKFVGTSTSVMAAGDSAGVVAQTHWNNAAGAARPTPLGLVNGFGTSTTATVTWTANNGWMTPIADQPGNLRLMKGYLDTSSSSVTKVTVAGLPSSTYDIHVYADGDNRDATRSASYRIAGSGLSTPGITATTKDLTDRANTNFSGTFAQSTGTTGNYLKFTLECNGFTLAATPGASTNTNRRAPINAIQIVRSSLTPPVTLDPPMTVGGLGAAQGVEVRDSKVYLYGDATTGIVREYDLVGNSALRFTGRQVRLTVKGQDVVPHPTGFTTMAGIGTLLGNTVAEQGTIFLIDWTRALATGTLDGAVQAKVADDLAANGTRPEFVRVGQRWLVATADYGAIANEIRIYDPQRLKTAARTSEPGVLVYRFRSSPFVQTLHWIDAAGLLVLAQNQRAGQGWRLTVVDLARSIEAGHQVVTQTIDLSPTDELEGFHLLAPGRGLFLTSSAQSNLYFANLRLF